MLFRRHDDGSLHPWTSGAARLFLEHQHGRSTLPVGVACRLGSLIETEIALLDTAASWSIIGAEIVEEIHDEIGEPLAPVRISTRHGVKEGHLHRMTVWLIAEQGSDLEIDCTCAILDDWSGPVVLGWRSMLERLHLAVQPGSSALEPAMLHFGRVRS